MKSDFQLSIPKPCSANWNEMTPNEQGKFCALCSLTVVDFTHMNEAEIKEYFQCHSGQKTCGRFKSTQLTPPVSDVRKFWAMPSHWIETNFRSSYLKAALLCCLTILAFMTGCRRPSTYPPDLMGDIDVTGEPQQEKVDTLRTTPIPVNPTK